MKTELRAKFLMSRCPDKGNAKDFLRGLRLKKEELVQVGVTISDEDYLSTIISSLPDALSNFASSQIAWMMQQNSGSIDINSLMSMLLQEADRQYLRSLRQKVGSVKGKEDEKNKALVVDQTNGKRKQDLSVGTVERRVTSDQNALNQGNSQWIPRNWQKSIPILKPTVPTVDPEP